MRELIREPVGFSWLPQIMGFYNRITQREDGDIVKIAMGESCRMAERDKTCWAAQLAQHLHRNGISDGATSIYEFQPLKTMDIMKMVRERWHSQMATNMDCIK